MDVTLLIIVAALSIVQSIFGMGLLVFGTPTLLLMGYSFSEILSILVPPSLTISLIQFIKYKEAGREFTRNLLLYCLPAMCLMLAVRFLLTEGIDISILVASLLIFSVVIRLSKPISNKLQQLLRKHSKVFLLSMGAVHGLSNMGGSLLSIYAISLHNNKKEILRCVVNGYVLFGIFQIMTLLLLGELLVGGSTVIFCTLAALSFLLVGNRLFFSVAESVYQPIFTVFMLIYASLLILD